MKPGKYSMSKKLKTRKKPIITDTSPLLLLLIGSYDKSAIRGFKRLSKYDSDDFDLLFQFVATRRIIITPQILAEVSNLAKELKNNPTTFSEIIEKNKTLLEKVCEKYIPKNDILGSQELARFGFTDASIIVAAKENDALVLTDDYPLLGICKRKGLDTKDMREISGMKEIFNTSF